MKINAVLTFALLTIVSIASVSGAAAQKRYISSREYYAAAYKGEAKWWERNHRVETIEEKFADGVVTSSIQRVSESLLPDKSREYVKTVQDGVTTEHEVITIGVTEYTRHNNGPWTKRIQPALGGGSGSGSGSGSSQIIFQFSIEPTTIDGIAVNLSESLMIDGTGSRLKFIEDKRWRADDGTPYRQEYSEGFYSPRVETYHKSTTTEYEPKITIEAPIK